MANIKDKYKAILTPALELVQRIMESKGLKNSNLIKNTKVINDNTGLAVIMPSYGIFVDTGRRGGKMPPLKALLDWIIRYRIRVPNEFTPLQFAYIIGRKIARVGTKGKHFLDIIANRLVELIAAYTVKLIDSQIKQI